MISLLLIFFAVAIVFSFLCSLWEAVLLSVTPSFARVQLNEGTSLGRDLQAFKENIDRPLAAILTLNTIAHTVGAIGVGNQAVAIWADTSPLVTALAIPVLMTLGILILSEIIPKTLGANYWRELVPFTVVSLRWVMKILLPLVALSQVITSMLKKDKAASVFSRTDFLAMAELGAAEGVIEQGESRIITNLLRFDSIRASDIMTPRVVVQAAPAGTSMAEFHSLHPSMRFSRIPIYEEDSKDHVTGFVLRHEILSAIVDGETSKALRELRRDILVIEAATPIPHAFDQLLRSRSHIALVVDEYGGTAGVLTMEDVIETLLGLEIVDELDRDEDMQEKARAIWAQRAQALGLLDGDGSSPDGSAGTID